ncbi:UNC-like C-terminal-domain-containing protein [Microdochium bolleyi]|uniref:UNC-like C-terminal-domain-containing protein n=1 Tax=Microdochium bolleyi TaxID=196109 RepID=A0A136JB64_9PEZI|nr:UNC-like C-terminal-domain-containing protein [Microdochium bolleyi]
MSFEEWKAMMLAKAGDNPEPRQRRAPDNRGEAGNGDFASLGDEGEINLDFDAFSDRISDLASASTQKGTREEKQEDQLDKITYEEGLAMVRRNKDAGRTCKERLSYSSFDAGATVKKTSPGTKNPSAILLENKDSYMLLECATENKFFIVELSDDILVDTIVLANYEFFSSMIRSFRVSISDRYPVKAEKWKVLGTFQARNSRDIQAFLVEHPQDWARYVRVEILSHWGNEFYCPISLLRVHGTRMMDAWKETDLDADDEPPKTLAIEEGKAAEDPEIVVEPLPDAVPEEVEVVDLEQDSAPVAAPLPVPEKPTSLAETNKAFTWDVTSLGLILSEPTCRADCEDHTGSLASQNSMAQPSEQTLAPLGLLSSDQSAHDQSGSQKESVSTPTSSLTSSSVQSTGTPPIDMITHRITVHTIMEQNRTMVKDSVPTTSATTGQTSPNSPSGATKSISSPQNPPPSSKGQPAENVSSKAPASRAQTAKSSASTPPSATTQRNKPSGTTGGAIASPTVQDSFFKALTKRLQVLESNTTLSLQYIESQSRFLQEALAKLERRQVSKVDQFLNTLNNTVLNELREVRTQYDQIWQSTVIALETQREQAEREIVALGSRVGVLADEVVFQKRMAIVQSILLLICLVLVIFSRGFAGNAAGLISADSAYYPGQFFASPGRRGSPVYPATPRSAYKTAGSGQNGRGGPEVAIDTSDNDATPNARNIRARHNSAQLGQALGHHERRDHNRAPFASGVDLDGASEQSNLRPAPPLSRAATTSAAGLISLGADYCEQQLPTPASSRAMSPEDGDEVGYDSEPNMTPSQRKRLSKGDDVFYFSAANSVADDGENLGAEEREARWREVSSGRQPTPASNDDTRPEEDFASRPLASRAAHMHSSSTRKPLPALPEDPD